MLTDVQTPFLGTPLVPLKIEVSDAKVWNTIQTHNPRPYDIICFSYTKPSHPPLSPVCTNPSACEASVPHIMFLNVDLVRREVVR